MRDYLVAVYQDWVNNYLTIEKFAEHKGLETGHARRLISLCKDIANDTVAPAKVCVWNNTETRFDEVECKTPFMFCGYEVVFVGRQFVHLCKAQEFAEAHAHIKELLS